MFLDQRQTFLDQRLGSSAPVLITPPTVDVLTVAEAKTMLDISSSSKDGLISAMIASVTATLDAASGGWLGRALRPQTWELRIPCFDYPEIVLPYPVVTSVTSVKYDDLAGVEQTMVEGTHYRVFGLNAHVKTWIAPPYQGIWPTARYDFESVRIRYVSGYAGAAMPAAIKSFIVLGVRNEMAAASRDPSLSKEEVPGVRLRAWVLTPETGALLKERMDSLIGTYRVWN